MIQTKRNYKKLKSKLTKKQRGGGQKLNKLSLNKRCKVNKKFSSKTKKGGKLSFFKKPDNNKSTCTLLYDDNGFPIDIKLKIYSDDLPNLYSYFERNSTGKISIPGTEILFNIKDNHSSNNQISVTLNILYTTRDLSRNNTRTNVHTQIHFNTHSTIDYDFNMSYIKDIVSIMSDVDLGKLVKYIYFYNDGEHSTA